ncbi:hypothetical protein HDU97_001359 [Phlyctochytrium planicorne]|nr:hypothetical protein HDU97_001359 [Phlyctochytrium planicorne]
MAVSSPVAWEAILIHIDDERDFSSAACVCKTSAGLASDVVKVKAPRLLRMHGSFLAIYQVYRNTPQKLDTNLLQALLDQNAYLPRYFVLCLSREREAQSEHIKQRMAHVEYRKQLQDQLELRATILEEQRLEGARRLKMALSEQKKENGDGGDDVTSTEDAEAKPDNPSMNTETAMMPLPAFPELKPVPAPVPLPTTPTSRLPHGVRDSIISWGVELYGCVFPPFPPPPSNPSERLPQNLQWISRLPGTSNPPNPCFTWPPDDAAFFSFLIKHAAGAGTLTKAKESWARICGGIRDLVERYGFLPNMFVGPDSEALAPWRTPGLDFFTSHGVASAPSSAASAASASTFAPTSVTNLHPWLPSEMFRYDRNLALFLGRWAGIPESLLTDEIIYWDLVASNIHVPPSRYNPSTQAGEAQILKSLSHLPKNVPAGPIRRLVLNHPSKALVGRLLNFVPKTKLEKIGEAVLSNLLGEPSNYGGVALKSADGLILAFDFNDEVVVRCFLASEELEGDTGPSNVDSFDEVEDVFDSYWDGAEYGSGENLDEAAKADQGEERAATIMPPSGLHRHMMTRQGRLTGTIQWTHWKWAVAKFGKNHVAARACLHDLAMRESLEDPNSERRWQFAEKEANAAVRNLVDEGVVPAPITVRRMAARILRDSRRREEGHGIDGSVVPPRFVILMAKVEKIVLQLAGSRAKRKPSIDVNRVLDAPGSVTGEGKAADTLSITSEPNPSHGPISPNIIPESPLSDPSSDRVHRLPSTATVLGGPMKFESLAAGLVTSRSRESLKGGRPLSVHSNDSSNLATPIEEAPRGPSPKLQPWLSLLQTSIIENEGWKNAVTTYAESVMVPLGGYYPGDPPEVRFYWATVGLVKDATDLTTEPSWLFAGWENAVLQTMGSVSSLSGSSGPGTSPKTTPGVVNGSVSGEKTPASPTTAAGTTSNNNNGKRSSAWEKAWARWNASSSTLSAAAKEDEKIVEKDKTNA